MRNLSLPSLAFFTLGALQTIACEGNAPVTTWGAGAGGGSGSGSGGASGEGGAGQGGAPAKPTALASGRDHVCVALDNGEARCWGEHLSGQLGDGSSSSELRPVSVLAAADTPFSEAEAIQQAGYRGCALKGGTILCWGSDMPDDGAPGPDDPKPDDEGEDPGTAAPPVVYPTAIESAQGKPFSGATAFALGARHACALTLDTGVHCWGKNDKGQLGNGKTDDSTYPVRVNAIYEPPVASALLDATAVGVGSGHSCALVKSEVHCWGKNDKGQLGDGKAADRPTPKAVNVAEGVPLQGATAIAVGGEHACALVVDGGVFCWGSNASGQLGSDIADKGPYAAAVQTTEGKALTGALALAVGEGHSCALMTGGEVHCWGANDKGQLGDGKATSRPRPAPVLLAPATPLAGAKALSLGTDYACAIANDGKLLCWGDNGRGQLGNATMAPRLYPAAVERSAGVPLAGVSAVAPGYKSTCALVEDEALATKGGVLCWGDNYYGELGNGATTAAPLLKVVSVATSPGVRLSGVKSLSLGADSSCAQTSNSLVYCWGKNDDGQLGDGVTTSRIWPFPAALEPGATPAGPASVVASGGAHSCAIDEGEVYCWGDNTFGQLGNGNTADQALPVLVTLSSGEPLDGVKAIDLGDEHTCAMTSKGEAYCWGRNDQGQLGNNTTTDRPHPERVLRTQTVPLDQVIAIASGGAHACAVRAPPGSAQPQTLCWGKNDKGQLGFSDPLNQLLPVPVTLSFEEGDNAEVHLELGGSHSCALLKPKDSMATAGGKMQCWGSNASGELGDGTSTDRAAPAPVVLDGVPLANLQAMALGDRHSCALTADGLVYCWGNNARGQTGGGPADSNAASPKLVQF